MATTLVSYEIRGTRRVRLFFSAALAAGAFTSTLLYGVTNTDGTGPNPIFVVGVFSVVNTPSAVELAVDEDWVDGAAYSLACTNVPCADTSLFTGTIAAALGLAVQAFSNVEPAVDDLPLLLYGRDLLHDGNDLVEDTTGDLATIAGRPNWQGALWRRVTSYGVNWDPSYSPHIDQYVDAPDALQLPLSGQLLAQARLDDRTKQASVSIAGAPGDPAGFVFKLSVAGRDNLDPVTIDVPAPNV